MSGVLGKIVDHVGDGSCSLIPGRGCFGDIPGGGVVESPSPPFVERLSRTVQVALSFASCYERRAALFLSSMLPPQ